MLEKQFIEEVHLWLLFLPNLSDVKLSRIGESGEVKLSFWQ